MQGKNKRRGKIMERTRKSRGLAIILSLMMILSLIPFMTVQTRADDPNAPMDFAADPSTRSGNGWSWDKKTSTLSLSDLIFDLTGYEADYGEAITLPDGATIVAEGQNEIDVSGMTADAFYRLGIYAKGSLAIKGNGEIIINADGGANGIQTEGAIQIGESAKPKLGLKLGVYATDFAVCSEKTLSVNGASLDLTTAGTSEEAEYFGTIVAENQDRSPAGVTISDSLVEIYNSRSKAGGISAYEGEIQITNTTYEQIGDDEATRISGISAGNGNVSVRDSKLVFDLGDADRNDGSGMISAASNNESTITFIHISGSDVTGSVNGDGFFTYYGGIEITEKSSVDVTAFGRGAHAGNKGLSVSESSVVFTNTGGKMTPAVRSIGPAAITDSLAYFTAKGQDCDGLYCTDQVTISGKETCVDAAGTDAAFKVKVGMNGPEVPITLNDGLEAVVGGTLQFVEQGNARHFSYSEDTLEMEGVLLFKNASKSVVLGDRDQMLFVKQPEDAVVSYPDGASFEVSVSHPENVKSYQWYLRDIAGKVFALDGTSAATNELIIPSTSQEDGVLVYYCEVTGKDGTTIKSKEATLDMNNREENKTVLYAGNYAIEPGQTLDLSKVSLGSGLITLAENGTDLEFDQVKFDNSEQPVYDRTVSPAIGIVLDRSNPTDENYTLTLKGDNTLKNTFYQEESGLGGITLHFGFRSMEDVIPTVVIDGVKEGGTLTVEGGTNGIRSRGNLILNTDLTTRPFKNRYMDGVVSETTLTVAPGRKMDLAVYGSGFSTDSALTIGENAAVTIDMTVPKVNGGQTGKTAIFVGGETFDLQNGSTLDITCKADPKVTTEILGCGGVQLQNGAGMNAKGSKITIGVSAGAYDEDYVGSAVGISGDEGEISLENTALSVAIAPEMIQTANGFYCIGNLNVENCAILIDTAATYIAYGLAAEGDLSIASSIVDVNTEYKYAEGVSRGILGKNLNFALNEPTYSISADTHNADGIALAANTGEGGEVPVYYDPSYKAKMIKGNFEITLPEEATFNQTSIEGSFEPYLYLETIYDTNDTTKPASAFAMKGKVKKAQTISGTSSYKKTYGNKAFKLDAKTNGDGKLTYASSSKKVVTVDAKGKVTIKGAGTATITIKASETGNYKAAEKKVKVKVAKAANDISVKGKQVSLKASKVANASQTIKKSVAFKISDSKGTLTFEKTKGNAKIKVEKNGKITVEKGLKAGKYTVKVKVKDPGNANYKAKTIKNVSVVIIIK